MGQKATQPGPWAEELGRQIAHAMIDAGFEFNTDLANATGFSVQTIGKVLKGSRNTSADEYALIAEALGVSYAELFVAAEKTLKGRKED